MNCKYIHTRRYRVPRAGHHPQRTLPTDCGGSAVLQQSPLTRSEGSAPPPDDDTLASVTTLLEIAFPHRELQHADQIGNPREFPVHRHTVAPASRRRPQTRPHDATFC
jgi:hypothetical protein